MWTREEGVQKSKNYADVICVCSLTFALFVSCLCFRFLYQAPPLSSSEALVDVVRRDLDHVVGEVVGEVDLAQLRLRGLLEVVVAQLLVYGLRGEREREINFHTQF